MFSPKDSQSYTYNFLQQTNNTYCSSKSKNRWVLNVIKFEYFYDNINMSVLSGRLGSEKKEHNRNEWVIKKR